MTMTISDFILMAVGSIAIGVSFGFWVGWGVWCLALSLQR